MVALDDLHWADPPTLLALHGLTKRISRLPIAVVVTLRPVASEATLDRVLEALHELGAEHLRLRPLGPAAVADLLTEAFGAAPGPGLVAQVRRAGGNPFYLHELARTLADSDALVVDGGVAEVDRPTLPLTLGTTILRHLRFLSEDTLTVLQHAAVLGTSFTTGELAAVSARSVDRLLAPLQEAVRAELVHDSPTGFSFRHDLVREALYERIPHGVRGELHATAARALAAIGAPVTQVATQFGRGARAGDVEVISSLRAAADETLRSAPLIAIDFLQQAIKLTPASDPGRDRMRADLACALVMTGGGTEAYELVLELRAGPHASELDGELAFTAGQALLLLGRHPEALGWLEEAAAAGSLSEAERALVTTEAAVVRVFGSSDIAAAERDVATALRCAEASGDRYATAFATAARSLTQLFRGEAVDAERLARLGVDHSRAAPDPRRDQLPSLLRDPFAFHGCTLLEVDRLDEAERAFRSGQQRSAEGGVTGRTHFYHFWLGLRHYHGGAWDDATAEFETGFTAAAELDSRGGALGAHALQALIMLHRDNRTAAVHHLALAERRLAQAGADFGMEWLALAGSLLAEASGDTPSACAGLVEAWDRFGALGSKLHYRVFGPPLVRVAVATGDRERAAVVTRDVQALAARQPVAGLQGAALRCRGLLRGDAPTLLEAVARYRDGARPLDRAAACEDARECTGPLRQGRGGPAAADGGVRRLRVARGCLGR